MPGPAPKNPATKRRTNKQSTGATLTRDHNVETPLLPGAPDDWHELTLQWWADIWDAPMAPEYDDSDRHGLFLLADLIDRYWKTDATSVRLQLAGEIRLMRKDFGLTPLDRRRLQWQVESTDQAQDKGRQRRAKTITAVDPSDDPRSALYSAS